MFFRIIDINMCVCIYVFIDKAAAPPRLVPAIPLTNKCMYT